MNNISVKFMHAAKLGEWGNNLADLGIKHYAAIVVIGHFKLILLQGKYWSMTAVSNNSRLSSWLAPGHHTVTFGWNAVSQFTTKTTVGFLKTAARMSIKLYDGTRMWWEINGFQSHSDCWVFQSLTHSYNRQTITTCN